MFRQFQAKLTQRLLGWSLFSIFTGLLMLFRGKFWRNVGLQFIGWGLIDGLIAVGGQFFSERRLEEIPVGLDSREVNWRDKQFLKMALWGNTFLDVIYVLGGIRWMRKQHDDDSRRGHGLGVIIQGLFLFGFDLYHAVRLQQVTEPVNE